MNFNDLDLKTKKELHEEVTQLATDIGGANVFLQMIEDIKKEQPHALLNKSCVFHFSKAKLNWNKQIFKESLTQLFSAMRKEEREGDMLNGLESKDYKETMNMMRTLKPITIRVTPKKNEELRGFAFSILDTSVEKNKLEKQNLKMSYKKFIKPFDL